MFCTLLAFACAFPTDSPVGTSTKHDNTAEVPTAYVHRPLANQQSVDHVSTVKTKRDVSAVLAADAKRGLTDAHLSSVQSHDNASPSFVKPVPVEQILGKGHPESHVKT